MWTQLQQRDMQNRQEQNWLKQVIDQFFNAWQLNIKTINENIYCPKKKKKNIRKTWHQTLVIIKWIKIWISCKAKISQWERNVPNRSEWYSRGDWIDSSEIVNRKCYLCVYIVFCSAAIDNEWIRDVKIVNQKNRIQQTTTSMGLTSEASEPKSKEENTKDGKKQTSAWTKTIWTKRNCSNSNECECEC